MMRTFVFRGLLFAACICSFAQPGTPTGAGTGLALAEEGHHRGPRQPPPEAFAACSSLSASDACTVTFHGHTLEGICRSGPDGKGALACVPKGPPPGPPPEAVEACSSLGASDACTVTHDGHTMEGICRSGPDGKGPLACAPKGPPPARE